jgi:hypothetical protein
MSVPANRVHVAERCQFWRLFLLVMLNVSMWTPQLLAQKTPSISTLDSVRVVFDQIDSVVFAFGLDTSKVRERIGVRLGSAIKTVESAQAPQLMVNLFVLGGAEESAAGVFLEVREPVNAGGSHQGRQLWRARGPHGDLPSYRLIPLVMGQLLDEQLNLLLTDRLLARRQR